jgi:hypothetical protein
MLGDLVALEDRVEALLAELSAALAEKDHAEYASRQAQKAAEARAARVNETLGQILGRGGGTLIGDTLTPGGQDPTRADYDPSGGG